MSHSSPIPEGIDPSEIPALAHPDGLRPNFDNPPNGNPAAYACIIICLLLASVSALTRTCFMLLTRTIPRIEDYLAVAAFALYLTYVYCAFWFMDICGYYVHQYNVRAVDMTEILYWTRIFTPKTTTKRGRTCNTFAFICYSLIVLNIAYYSSVIIAGNLACTPYERIWDYSVEGTCSFDPLIVLVTTGGINLVSDLCILIMPQGKIWHLNMSLQKKISVSIVFSLGLTCIIAASIRVWAGVNAYVSDDKVYNIADVALWCMVEITMGFVVFCLPMAPKVYYVRRMLRFGTNI
ncbi:hypothetical protein B0I35DRAFT_484698 [Stachybotrys elegans]|uniref:Rhodopsin domain-containing protein n=1 Tax=Stachybotrys elegans TaxID=80388 RepID=A0A8K0SE54_9HYPO|nr:hypothetical protein B0I35DRAFT_484698 [Stachybotrys elegans]